MIKKLIIAYPHGFCAGVERAIAILEQALEVFGSPIYVNHEIVHNDFLVKHFEGRGVVFAPEVEEIPEKSVMIFSAHGISPQYREQCEKRGLKIIDATCPLVSKVHMQARNFDEKGYKVLIIGEKNHQEIKGTSGIAPLEVFEDESDIRNLDEKRFQNEKVVCLTQTTLSMDYTRDMIAALKVKIPHLEVATGICYASQNRQNAVKELAEKCDFIMVIGSKNSSNSNKLVDTAEKFGCKALLVDDHESIPSEISNYEVIGLTSGASVPEDLFEKVIDRIKFKNKGLEIEKLQLVEEKIKFPFLKEFK